MSPRPQRGLGNVKLLVLISRSNRWLRERALLALSGLHCPSGLSSADLSAGR